MTGQSWDLLLVAWAPAAHWIGPEMLVDLMIEGRNVNALVDSGSQVNTIMPAFMQQCGFPVLPLVDIVDHLLNLVGLGGKCPSLLGFIILCVQVRGYDEDVVFLMVPDKSEFGCRVPLVIGTCTIGRIFNVIWESEIDCLSTPCAMVQMAQLLSCWRIMVVFTPESAGEAQSEGASEGLQEVDVDELVTVKESIRLGLFQTEIIEGRVKPLLWDMAHVKITPLKAGEGQSQEARPLPRDSTFSMCTCTSRMEVEEFYSWLGTCPIATSSLRRGCWWRVSCQHHWCPQLSCHQRWKPLLAQKPNQNPCLLW